MRVVFMGTGEIAIPTLRYLIDGSGREGFELVAVYTQPDKPVGRKLALTPPEIKTIAEAAGIPVIQPESFRGNEEAIAELNNLSPDLIVVMAYGQILPRVVLDLPEIACVNLHASLLPRHRGAAPIQAAIRDGDVESGITLMVVSPRLDAGAMILKKSLVLSCGETGGSLHDRLALLGPAILKEGLPILRTPHFSSEDQDESLATHTGKLSREDGEIDWTLDAADLERLIRAYDPWPGTTTNLPGDVPKRIKVYPFARMVPGEGPAPGTVISSDDRLVVQCGSGALSLEGDLQLDGKRRLPVAEFLRGCPIPVGTILGRGEIEV